ncbi:MAG: hypothetical protein A2166_02085 [Omnitrophica WOR_2 bacterium RBG_13_41_10]|nr:MAG: hypothetical protein A2166_02085 [Omnitrophica WOR_2 bacterium RBG_13_41_10]
MDWNYGYKAKVVILFNAAENKIVNAKLDRVDYIVEGKGSKDVFVQDEERRDIEEQLNKFLEKSEI